MIEIPVSMVSLSGWNPRSDTAYKDEEFNNLKRSIQENGFFPHHALLVRPAGSGYELITGHRRLAAARELGLKTVPVTVQELSDPEAKLILAADNFNRSDFKPMEEAAYLQKLLEEGDITQEQLGKKLGKSQAYIANRLRLLAAPEELKEMVISREISPKHVIALLPYSGYPVFSEILDNLKKAISEKGKISVISLEKLVGDTLSSYGCESVLNIDDMGFDYKEYLQHMDLSDCDGCDDIKNIEKYGEKHRYCLNRRCWKNMVNKAKNLFEKERAGFFAKMTKADIVNTNGMAYGSYKTLKYAKWSRDGCKGCGNCKTDESKDLICIDPACFSKKERAHTREQNRIAKEKEQLVIAEVDEWIDKVIEPRKDRWEDPAIFELVDLRGVLRLLAGSLWTEAVKKAFKPWGSAKSALECIQVVDKIEDKDLTRALFRLVFHDRLDRGYGSYEERLQRIFARFRSEPVSGDNDQYWSESPEGVSA